MLKRKKWVFDYSALIITATLTFTSFAAYKQKNGNKEALEPSNRLSHDTAVKEDEDTISPFSLSEDSDKGVLVSNSTENLLTNKVDKKGYEIINHIVKAGDTVEEIASTYNIKTSTIIASNNITSKTILQVGQALQFPSSDGLIYELKAGENLWDLAQLNDSDYDRLLVVNNIKSPETLQIGEKIFVPDVEKVKSPSSEFKRNTNQYASASYSRGGKVSFTGIMPTQGTISSKFGKRWGRQHKGIDIAANTGTKVVAFQSGKVTFSGWNGGYGNLVIIDHGNGIQSYYAHNSKNLVQKGSSVQKGEVIAKVGNTGNSTGPHCHFEIRVNGTPVNPLNYIN